MTEQDYLKLWQQVTSKPMTTREVEFATLVAAAEREVCAQVCEAMRPTEREFDQRFYTACTLNANAIRNKGIE